VSASLLIDDFGPLPTATPSGVAELGELIREAQSLSQGLYPYGGGVFSEVGYTPSKPGKIVDMAGFNQVIDYPARDMTITLQAGCSIQQMQQILAKEGQELPVDLPFPEKLSIGAALALNLSGPRRLFRGTLRDYLIGVHQMTDEGQEVKGGGRVVKNVAGYDLMKLQIGALGTLGIITQVTLKVIPKAEERAALAFGLNAAAIGPTLDRLQASAARPVFVELLNSSAARIVAAQAGVKLPEFDPWVLVVGFEEKAKTVEWQLSTLKDELKAAPSRELIELRGSAVGTLLVTLTNFQAQSAAKYIWKANLLPSRVAEFVAMVANEPTLLVHAQALNGIVWLQSAGEEYDPTSGSRLVDLDQASLQAGGNLVVRRCPIAMKKGLRLWGRTSGETELMKLVKQTLDPNDLFNSGRFFTA
jgi:glycolate oxidase FAD binding subunit